MATITLQLQRTSGQCTTGILYFRITHRRSSTHLSTHIRLRPDEWDGQRIISDNPDKQRLQIRLNTGMLLLQSIVRQLDTAGKPYTAHDVARRLRNPVGPTLLPFMQEQIDSLYRCGKIGTANNYERTMHSFAQFAGGDIPLATISEALIDLYHAFLAQRGLVRNSVSFYMRILRAVYNKAVRRKLVAQNFPFQNVYTGIDKTRKRAIDEAVIAQLYKLRLPAGSALALARDLFIFSYCTRGMAFVDMAYLKKTDIQGGIIHYTRRKTGQLLAIKIEPDIQEIIARYAVRTANSAYVFPLLSATGTHEAYKQYRSAINRYNYLLHKLSAMLPAGCNLTSYTARHSWASAARKHNAPLPVISAGLGHTSEKTTQIYLTSLENSAIDIVNQGIISRLNG